MGIKKTKKPEDRPSGWLGTSVRKPGRKQPDELYLVRESERLFFTWGNCRLVYVANGFGTTVCVRSLKHVFADADSVGRLSMCLVRKSSRALALKAAKNWANGKTQKAWRDKWASSEIVKARGDNGTAVSGGAASPQPRRDAKGREGGIGDEQGD